MSGPLAWLSEMQPKPEPQPGKAVKPMFETKEQLRWKISRLCKVNEEQRGEIKYLDEMNRKYLGQINDSSRMLADMRQEIGMMRDSNQVLLKQLNELWQSQSRSLANQTEQQEDHNQNGHNHQRDLGDPVERLGQRHHVDQVGQQPEDQPDNDQVDDQIDERLDHGRIL